MTIGSVGVAGAVGEEGDHELVEREREGEERARDHDTGHERRHGDAEERAEGGRTEV